MIRILNKYLVGSWLAFFFCLNCNTTLQPLQTQQPNKSNHNTGLPPKMSKSSSSEQSNNSQSNVFPIPLLRTLNFSSNSLLNPLPNLSCGGNQPLYINPGLLNFSINNGHLINPFLLNLQALNLLNNWQFLLNQPYNCNLGIPIVPAVVNPLSNNILHQKEGEESESVEGSDEGQREKKKDDQADPISEGVEGQVDVNVHDQSPRMNLPRLSYKKSLNNSSINQPNRNAVKLKVVRPQTKVTHENTSNHWNQKTRFPQSRWRRDNFYNTSNGSRSSHQVYNQSNNVNSQSQKPSKKRLKRKRWKNRRKKAKLNQYIPETIPEPRNNTNLNPRGNVYQRSSRRSNQYPRWKYKKKITHPKKSVKKLKSRKPQQDNTNKKEDEDLVISLADAVKERYHTYMMYSSDMGKRGMREYLNQKRAHEIDNGFTSHHHQLYCRLYQSMFRDQSYVLSKWKKFIKAVILKSEDSKKGILVIIQFSLKQLRYANLSHEGINQMVALTEELQTFKTKDKKFDYSLSLMRGMLVEKLQLYQCFLKDPEVVGVNKLNLPDKEMDRFIQRLHHGI